MKIGQDDLRLIHSAITHFIGEAVVDVNVVKDSYVFTTHFGRMGMIEPNYLDNYDIWMGDEIIYVIEKDLFDIIMYERNFTGGLIEFYDKLKKVDNHSFQEKSKVFFDIMKTSIENIILNFDLPLTGRTMVGTVQVHYTPNNKIRINLN